MKAPVQSPSDELAWFAEVIARHQIPYWIDSGTLLGLVRDGRLLPNDNDIDLGIWADAEASLPPFIAELRGLGFRLTIYSHRGQPYKYKLHPGPGHFLEVDLNLFREAGDHAWCPATIIKQNPARPGTPMYYLQALMHFPLRRIYDGAGEFSSDTWPWSHYVQTRTWWAPSHHFRGLECEAAFGMPTPSHTDSYLKLRYGEWRTPRSDWQWWSDDGGLQHCSPEELLPTANTPELGQA